MRVENEAEGIFIFRYFRALASFQLSGRPFAAVE
jgi:hypothetical protein